MKNPLNKLFVPFKGIFIFLCLMTSFYACNQDKRSENVASDQTEAVSIAWKESGEWVQKLSLSSDKIIRNTSWGQDFASLQDTLELSESQPDKGKSYTLYFDDTNLNFSDITYIPNEKNKLTEIDFDIFVDSSEDVQPLIDQWKGYLDSKFGASDVKGKQIQWLKDKNTRILLENVSTPKDPGIKISFKAAN